MAGKWMRRVGTAAFALAVIALAAACGGGGGTSSSTPEGSPTDTIARPTPFPTPVIVGNQATSLKGYTVTFPANWKPRPNFINTVDATIDTYFEPTADAQPNQVQANISVACQVVRDLSPAAYAAASATRTARLPQNKDIVESQAKVSGVDATVLRYRSESGTDSNAPRAEKQDMVFSNSKCDWTLTLTAPDGQFDKYKPAFDAFVASFKLT